MIPALSAAASGIRSGFTRLDRAANDIANVDTTGYRAPGARSRPGAVIATGSPLDLAVDGVGWFRVASHDGSTFGETLVTRAGSFHQDAQGFVVAADGRYVVGYALDGAGSPTGTEVRIQLPRDAVAVSGGADGIVRARDASGGATDVAALSLARFADPEGLEAVGGGLYRPTPSSGPGIAAPPGTGSVGLLHGSALETSNVDLADALVTQLLARHQVAANVRSLDAAAGLLQELDSIDVRG